MGHVLLTDFNFNIKNKNYQGYFKVDIMHIFNVKIEVNTVHIFIVKITIYQKDSILILWCATVTTLPLKMWLWIYLMKKKWNLSISKLLFSLQLYNTAHGQTFTIQHMDK